MTIFIGIDPGLDGAIAFVKDDGSATVCSAPTGKVGKKRDYLLASMASLLDRQIDQIRYVAAVERVHSMPKQGVASSFNFGKGFGLWLGLLAGRGIPFDLVEPTRWKKVMLDGMGRDKDAARLRAQQLFPALAPQLSLKKDHGRAEALLIAEYRRRIG